MAGDHDQSLGIEDHVGIAGVIEGRQFANLRVFIPGNLDRIAVGLITSVSMDTISKFLSWSCRVFEI